MIGKPQHECRLLYVIGQLHCGGSERQLYSLLKSMDRGRYRPAVVVSTFREDDCFVKPIADLGVPLYSLPFAAAQKPFALHGWIKKLRPEVVHSWSFYTNALLSMASLGLEVVTVGSLRNDLQYSIRRAGFWRGWLSQRFPRHQIANSEAAAEQIRGPRGFPAGRRVTVVRNALDLQEFVATPVQCTGVAHIRAIGALIHTKRWDRLVQAASRLRERGLDVVVEIAGRGPQREELVRLAGQLEVSNHVCFVGHVEDIPRFLAGASFLVHCADHEGTPNAVMEAMACGRAVVATNVGDVSLLVEHGKTGFVVERDDDSSLIKSLLHLIQDRKACQRMGEAGRIKSEQDFTTDQLVDDMLEVYRQAGWKERRPVPTRIPNR